MTFRLLVSCRLPILPTVAPQEVKSCCPALVEDTRETSCWSHLPDPLGFTTETRNSRSQRCNLLKIRRRSQQRLLALVKGFKVTFKDYDPMVRVSPTYRRRWLQRRREEEKEKPRLGSRGHLNIGRIYVSRSRMREKGGRRRKEPREERDAEWSAYKVDTK